MIQFSREVKEMLVNAGWFEGRCINTDLYKKEISAEGYSFYNSVEVFLREFGELQIVFAKKGTNTTDCCHFKVSLAVSGINQIWVNEDYFKRIRKRVCVIGQAYSNHLTIMMDEDGKVYGRFDDNLYSIASTGKEGIQAICLCNKFEEILPLVP